MELVIVLIILVVILIGGLPAGFAIGAGSLLYLAVTRGITQIPYEIIAQRMTYGLDSFPILAIPLFILMGEIMNRSGVTERIFDFANSLVGHLTGGLGHVNVIASMIFAGMSGSGTADAAGLGRIEIKAMVDAGYDLEFSTAITGATTLIGPIIPPSIGVVLYGIWAQVSIAELFMAAFVPGVLMGIALMIHVAVVSKKRNYPKSKKHTNKERALSFKHAFFPLMTPVILIGGIMSGQFTATESAAIAALYALIMATILYRAISMKATISLFYDVAIDSSKIMFIFATSSLLAWVLTRARVPYILADAILALTTNVPLIMTLLILFFLLVGCFLSVNVSINLLTPIIVPVIVALGIDPIVFGVVMIMTLGLGNLTPPFGIALYVLTDISNVPFLRLSLDILPYLGTIMLVIILVILFPSIATFLPSLVL